MTTPLDRTWYNTLVDDDGSGAMGSVWNKAAVDSLMDAVDASLVSIVDKTGTAVANEVATFADADTVRGGSGLLAPGSGNLTRTTAPGADNSSLALSGSGAVDINRGALISVAGNQSGAPGFVTLAMGNIAGSAISFNRGAGAMVQMLNTGVIDLLDGQLKFPATQKPSTNLQTFDDYREGVFTIYLTATGGASGQSYAAQRAVYQKFGRWVQVEFEVQLSVLGTFTGNIIVAGLPFVADATTYVTRTVPLHWHGLATTHIGVTGVLIPGNAHFELYAPTGATSSSITTPLTAASMTASTAFYGNFRYATTN